MVVPLPRAGSNGAGALTVALLTEAQNRWN
jgi:hypothetical protein